MTPPEQTTPDVTPEETTRVDDALARLRAVGERVTPARRAVLAVVDAADAAGEHLTAEQIGARVGQREPSVHRATLYRTLTSLTELGALSHVHLGGSATVYHLGPGPQDPATGRPGAPVGATPTDTTTDTSAATHDHGADDHAHVQCHRCGRVLDVAPEVLADVARRLEAELGFELDTSHAALLGTCRDCRTVAGGGPGA